MAEEIRPVTRALRIQLRKMYSVTFHQPSVRLSPPQKLIVAHTKRVCKLQRRQLLILLQHNVMDWCKPSLILYLRALSGKLCSPTSLSQRRGIQPFPTS
ncbi:hypothetical protein JG687_00004662 [Phytophthora cactorum]|uniref:Uncharacterized protein n=1 Tax=Phytophthora cactorum TaxID=29920 RepID=A0A8T1USM3_9STRA|nr:hypothetical protein JG687_00004662 [Phytophthora cactorum]